MVKINQNVEQFNQAMRTDPNAMFITLDNDSHKMKFCVVNNITDEVIRYDAPIGPSGIFYEAAKNSVVTRANNDFNNLSNAIRNQVRTFYYLVTNPWGQTTFTFTRIQ